MAISKETCGKFHRNLSSMIGYGTVCLAIPTVRKLADDDS